MASSSCPAPRFPCVAVPQDPREARLLGLYEQRQKGFFMQRIKVPGGRITIEQWRAVAELARRFTPGAPLHLTTRQDLEFHDLVPENVPALQRGLRDAGLSGVGACGDTLRNVTVCPNAGLHPGSFDLGPLADAVRERLEALGGIYSLPRKFKISLSGCADGCARPWINDLGIVANEDGTFRAIVGGSLGPRPGAGVLCHDRLRADEIPAFATAALRLFEAEGDRNNRGRARLRHVRERMGDGPFRDRLDALFQEEKEEEAASPQARKTIVAPMAPPNPDGFAAPARLHVPNGELAPGAILELLDAFEKHASPPRQISIGFEHDLFLHGIVEENLPDSFRSLTGGPRILACPGAHSCARGLALTREMAATLREALPKNCDLMIGISGCPNNCCHSAVADIGLVGKIKKIDGERRTCYQVLVGGGNGKTPVLGREAHPGMPEDRVPDMLKDLLLEWKASSPEGGDSARKTHPAR